MGRQTKLTYIDIFAGCGGISLGLYNAGWRGLFAIEKDEMAFQTLKHNLIDKKKHFDWPEWLPQRAHDINDVMKRYEKELKDLREKVHLVAGGPPCQGFSTAGKRKSNDERNKLVNSYIRFIELVRPKIVFFENVKGFTAPFGKNKKAYSSQVLVKLRKMRYNADAEVVDFSDFGIPQRRRRFILAGFLDAESRDFFTSMRMNKTSFLKRKGLNTGVTVEEAISDIEMKSGVIDSTEFKKFKEGVYSKPRNGYQFFSRKGNNRKTPDSHRFANHKNYTVEKFNFILRNCTRNKTIPNNIKEMFGIKKKCIIPIDGSKKCPTLTTLPDDYIHYSEPRILTVREYARLQSFPDWYEIMGKYTTGGLLRKKEVPRYTQMGNAVPPLYVERAGEVFKVMCHG